MTRVIESAHFGRGRSVLAFRAIKDMPKQARFMNGQAWVARWLDDAQTWESSATLGAGSALASTPALLALEELILAISASDEFYTPVPATYNEVLTLALSANLGQAGGMTFDDAITLAVQAAEARAGILSALAAASLGVIAGKLNGTSGTTYTDDFNRANGAMGASWVNVGGNYTNDMNPWTIQGNKAGASQPYYVGNDNMMKFVPMDGMVDGYIQSKIWNTDGDARDVSLAARVNLDVMGWPYSNRPSGYIARIELSGATHKWMLYCRYNPVGWTTLAAGDAGSFSAGDTLKMVLSGTSIKLYVNDSEVASVTDSTFTGGGLWGYVYVQPGNPATVYADDFECGTLGGTADMLNDLALSAGVSLGVTADALRSSVLTAIEAYAFGVAVAKAATGGADFNEAVILTANAVAAQTAIMEMNAGLSLAVSADQGTGSIAEMDAVIALSLAMAMLQSESLDTGVSTYDEAATLAAKAGMSQASIATLNDAVALATAAGLGLSGQSIMANALMLQATASMIRSSVGLLSTSVGFGISAGEDFGTALVLQASVLLDAKGGLSGIGGMSFDDEASFGTKSGMAQSVAALLSTAVSLNARASQAQANVMTAEARVALNVACDQVGDALRTHNLTLALSIVSDMGRWGIVPRIAAAKFTFDAIARQREYDATARQREYDAASKDRENDDD